MKMRLLALLIVVFGLIFSVQCSDINAEPVRTLKGHTTVESVSFSPDGKYLASGSRDRTIKFWSLATGQCIKTLKGHTDWVG